MTRKKFLVIALTLAVITLVVTILVNRSLLFTANTWLRGGKVDFLGKELKLRWGDYYLPQAVKDNLFILRLGNTKGMLQLSKPALDTDVWLLAFREACKVKRCTEFAADDLAFAGGTVSRVRYKSIDSRNTLLLTEAYRIKNSGIVLQFEGPIDAYSSFSASIQNLLAQLAAPS